MSLVRRPRPEHLSLATRLRSALLRGPAFLAATTFYGTCSLIASMFEKDGRMQHRIARRWARDAISISGSKLTVVGGEHLREHPVAVYAANHTSYMDTPVVFGTLPFQFRILAKKELWKLPFIGWWLNRSGQLPIDVSNPRNTLSSLTAAARALKAGMPIFVYPEGGRTKDGQLQEFLAGAAFMAIKAQVPVVPITLIGVYDLLPIHTGVFYPQPLTLVVGEPIPTTGLTLRQAEELTQTLRARIAAAEEQAAPAQELAAQR